MIQESANEAVTLIAKVIEMLKQHECLECDYDDAIPFLNDAIDKLTDVPHGTS